MNWAVHRSRDGLIALWFGGFRVKLSVDAARKLAAALAVVSVLD